jgi:hypothetical protein
VVPQADGRAASTYGDLDARLDRVTPGCDEWCGRFALKFGLRSSRATGMHVE